MEIELLENTEVIDRAEINHGNVLVKYSKTEAELSALRAKHEGVVFDLTTTKGDKEARAARLELVTLRTSLEKNRKEFKAPALDLGGKIDSEAKRVTAEIVKLETFIDQQIKADETRRANEKAERERIEALRVQAIQEKIAVIRGFVVKCQDISAERIAKGIELVGAIDTSAAVFFEFESNALAAQVETLQSMRTMYDSALAREAEVARVEAQRIENERIAEQQRIQAVAMAAQQAALDKAAADIKIEQDRLERLRIAQELEAAAQARDAAEKAISNAQKQVVAPVEPEHVAIETETVQQERIRSERSASEITVIEQTQQAPEDQPVTLESVKEIAPIAFLSPDNVLLDPRTVDKEIYKLVQFICKDPEQVPATPPTMKLGMFSERFGFNVTAEFLKRLGFAPAATDKASKLFHERDFNAICDALVHHIKNVQFAYALQNVSVK